MGHRSELAANQEMRPNIIFDAIHQVMRAPTPAAKLLKTLMDLPVMQRLRWIKQGGLADMVFPTATHTRFSHVLGTCHLAGRMLEKLRIDDPYRIKITLAAALLHDIGHGPFSHSLEGFFKDPKILGIDLRHENWTGALFRSTDLEGILRAEVGQTGLETIIAFITLKGNARAEVLPEEDLLLADIISSQLDADRLDYLLRDSHFCGVSYGNYDLEWLLTCLQPVEIQGRRRLGIARKGVGAVEQFLTARRLMYQNIYYNKSNMAWERILIEFLKEVCYLSAAGDEELQQLLGSHLKNFLTGLAPGNFRTIQEVVEAKAEHYQLLCDYDILRCIREVSLPAFHPLPERANLKKLANRLYNRVAPTVIRLNNSQGQPAIQAFRNQMGFFPWQIGIIEHSSFITYVDRENPLAVKEDKMGGRGGDGKVVPLEHYSPLMKAICNEIEPQYFLMIDQELCENHSDGVYALLKVLDS